jgi:hypothetical protein
LSLPSDKCLEVDTAPVISSLARKRKVAGTWQLVV